MASDKETTEEVTAEDQAAEATGVVWDDAGMQTNFANVVNIQSTQEQVDLFFGTNKTWDAGGPNRQVKVELSNRLILGPHAAKRLVQALTGVMNEYESRYGKLPVGTE